MIKKAWHTQFKKASKEQRTNAAGITFDSKLEMRRWAILQQWQLTGEIKDLKRQVAFKLILPDETPVKTPTGRTAIYTCDFSYLKKVPNSWETVIEDCKGFSSREAQLRISIFEAIYKVKVKIVKK